MALAQWHRRRSRDLERAIEHFDLVAEAPGSAVSMRSVHAWKATVLFDLNRVDAAFAAIDAALAGDRLEEWEWFRCANLVKEHGKKDAASARRALRFWRRFLKFRRGDVIATSEVFACEWLLHEDGIDTKAGFERFKGYAETMLAVPGANAALIWDRVGHWAQTDHDWQQAEAAFRHAFDLEPNHYAYCLGVALNHLDRFEDALAVLAPATELADADSLVWFQAAFANERIGDVESAAEGYRRAIALEPGYALAHFNLGGVLWNDGQEDEARLVWREAIVRFPEHELAAKLEKELPHVFATLQNR